MHAPPLLQEIAIIAAVGVFVTVVIGRWRLPMVAGLLLSGALIGPHGFQLVGDLESIDAISEVGVVLLLFTIGLEFSLERLRHIFRHVAVGGSLQVGATIVAVAAVTLLLGRSPGTSILYGFVFSLSSTAIVLRALGERREVDAPHGRFIVGALIFQDLCVVPMVLLVPLLGGETFDASTLRGVALALGKATAIVAAVLVIARLVVPRALGWVEASRSREVFLLAVLALCVGTAWLTSLAGVSLALGAFLGGVVVAGTEFRHRALGDVLPLRDVFLSVFFVSLGMLFDAKVVLANPLLVAVLLAGFTLGKGLLATAAAVLMRFPARAAWLAGVGLAQFGEFGFVLVRLGTAHGLMDAEEVAPLLCAGILSMFLTPVLARQAPHVTAGERLLAPLARLLRARSIEQVETLEHVLKEHVVVVGYGLAGKLVSASLRILGVPFVVLELNAENVRQGRANRDPVYYADATSQEALGHAHVGKARAVVVLINDPQAVIRVVDTLRRVAPEVPIHIRTHYLAEAQSLMEAGATDVVAEEVEGGVEVLARVLRELEMPRNVIDGEIRRARDATQPSARRLTLPRRQSLLSGLKVDSVLVFENSPGAHRSARELELRNRTGASLVAIRRGEELLANPSPDEKLLPGDVVFLLGKGESMRSAIELLGPSEAAG